MSILTCTSAGQLDSDPLFMDPEGIHEIVFMILPEGVVHALSTMLGVPEDGQTKKTDTASLCRLFAV